MIKEVPIICDHAGVELKNQLINCKLLKDEGVLFQDIYLNTDVADDYPDVAQILNDRFMENNFDFAVAICGSGVGMCIALNRFMGLRAFVGHDLETVKIARQHNKANVLCLGSRLGEFEDSRDAIIKFVKTSFEEEKRHLRRLNKLDKLKTDGVR